MGKVKNKNGSEVEYLRGVNKELRAENKSLKRQIRDLQKHEHMYEKLPEEEPEFVSRHISCPSCGKGVLIESEFLGKVYGVCNVCSERKKLK